MSFGYSIGDAVLLTHLAWKTVQNARRACGEHDELTQEVRSLHMVLRRLEQAIEKPESPSNGFRSGESDNEELQVIVNGCRRVLSILDQVLTKYNALGEQERSGRKLWQKIKFGNGKMADLAQMRAKLTYYTSATSLFLNMVSMGTMGRVERQMNDTGGDLKEIKTAVNGITAHLMSSSIRHEGSVLTAYADDDRAVWKEFRRELLKNGVSSSVIEKHKRVIKAYIEELGSRGLFDEEDPNMDVEEHSCDVDSPVERATAYRPETQYDLKASSEVESPVESTPQPDFDIGPDTASRSETESRDRQRLVNDNVSEPDSEPRSKPEMRWMWLRNENERETQHHPAVKIRKPTKMVKQEQDENAARLLHSMTHELYDGIVPNLIRWGCSPSPSKIDLSTLIDEISCLRARLRRLHILSYSKQGLPVQDLMSAVDMFEEFMKHPRNYPPKSRWTDQRSSRLGYIVHLLTLEDGDNLYSNRFSFFKGPQFCSRPGAYCVGRTVELHMIKGEPHVDRDRELRLP